MRRNEFSRYVTSFESVKGKGRLQEHIVSAGFLIHTTVVFWISTYYCCCIVVIYLFTHTFVSVLTLT